MDQMYRNFEIFVSQCETLPEDKLMQFIEDVTGEIASLNERVLRNQLCIVWEEIMRGNVSETFIVEIFSNGVSDRTDPAIELQNALTFAAAGGELRAISNGSKAIKSVKGAN